MSDLSELDLTDGIRLLQAGQLAAAADFFSNVVQREPSNGQAFGYLGMVLTRLGQTDAALNALGQASQLQPQDPAAQYNVAIGLMHAGRQQDAVPFLQYTLQLEPNHGQARAALDSIITGQPPTSAQPSAPNSTPDPQWTAGNPSAPVRPATASLSGPVYPASQPQGMQYTQSARPYVVSIAPDTGTKLLRGLGWGALYGQWWTVWMMFWTVAWSLSHFSIPGLFVLLLVFVCLFGVCGVLAGLIIAVLPPSMNTGIAVGIVFAMVLFGIELLISRSGATFVNIFFWFFTGRYIGSNIAVRVHRPIQQ